MAKFYVPEGVARRLDALLEWFENTGQHIDLPRYRQQDPQPPIPMHIGKAAETIAQGESGNIQPWGLSSTQASTAPFAEGSTGDIVEAWDWIETGASTGEKVYHWRHQQSGRMVFLKPDVRFTALLKGSLSAGSTSATVDNVKMIYGPNPTTGLSAEMEVANSHSWAGQDNSLCRVEYHNTNKRHELYQLNCT